jgi:hypothetical protein
LSDEELHAETGRRVKEPEFNDCLQGCDSHITWQTVTAFRWNLLPPSSRQKNKPCGRQVRNYLPELTASHLKRIQLHINRQKTPNLDPKRFGGYGVREGMV